MTTDPRLRDTSLLTLAAFRIRHRRQHQVPDWRSSEGLSSLLDAARSLPRRDDPWDLSGVDTTSGLGKLLAEARLKAPDHGA
jgi:hypothetical protein